MPPPHNFYMKIFVSLLVSVGFLWGVYILFLKRMPTVAEGTASTQAISLTGVPMDELLSSGSMSLSRPERDGYTYSVECSGNAFTVTARHPAAPAGSPIRYPQMMIDQTMQVREVE